MAGKIANGLFVAAEGKPLVETSIELTLEFAECPALLRGLYFVEGALLFFEP
jgi:hypothetical protein